MAGTTTVTTEKKALKGLTAGRLWPVTANTSSTYTVGTKIELVGLQSLTKERSVQEYTIYADDGVYDSGSDFLYEDFTVKIAELPLDLEAKLQGSTFDEDTNSYTFKITDAAPEYAMAYAARRLDGNYRIFKHYCVKLLKIKIEHKPKTDGTDIQAYELTLRATQRVADGAPYKVTDSTDKSYAQIETVDTIEPTT